MNLFTYGSLEFPAVMEAVTGRAFPASEALLPGFARGMLLGVVYPGIVAREGAVTSGVLYRELDAEAFVYLDRFEGDVYERRTLRVDSGRGGDVEAFAYVVHARHTSRLTAEPWRREHFASVHLESYLASCRRFHRALRSDRG